MIQTYDRSFENVKDYQEFKSKNHIKSLPEALKQFRFDLTREKNNPKHFEVIQKDSKFLLENFKVIREKEKGIITHFFCKIFPRSDYAKKVFAKDESIKSEIKNFETLLNQTKLQKELGKKTIRKWDIINKNQLFRDLSPNSKDGEINKTDFAKDSAAQIRTWLSSDPKNISEAIKASQKHMSETYLKKEEGVDLPHSDRNIQLFKAMLISSTSGLTTEEIGKFISLKDKLTSSSIYASELSLALNEIDQEVNDTKKLWGLAIEQIKKKEYPSDEYVLDLINNATFREKAAEEIRTWLNSNTSPQLLIHPSVEKLMKWKNTEESAVMATDIATFIDSPTIPQSDQLISERLGKLINKPNEGMNAEKTNEFVLAMLLSSIQVLNPQELAKLKESGEAWYEAILSVNSKAIRAMPFEEKEQFFIQSAYVERLHNQITVADKLGAIHS